MAFVASNVLACFCYCETCFLYDQHLTSSCVVSMQVSDYFPVINQSVNPALLSEGAATFLSMLQFVDL